MDDISPGRLKLNRENVEEAGCEQRIVARVPLDITDLSRFPECNFDRVVCFGGPLSYVFDRADDALAEMLRITRWVRPVERDVPRGGDAQVPGGRLRPLPRGVRGRGQEGR